MSDRAIWEHAARMALEEGQGYRCFQGNMMARFHEMFPSQLEFNRAERCIAMLFMAEIEDSV